jgi:hypothetical protein
MIECIEPPHRRPVDEVLALSAAMQAPRDRDLGVVEPGELAVRVVEEELDLAEVGRAAIGAAREEHVVRLLRAQLLRRQAPRGPDDRIGDVRLPRSVRPDDDGDARLEPHLHRVGEGLEAAQLDRLEMHRRRSLTGGVDSVPSVASPERASSLVRQHQARRRTRSLARLGALAVNEGGGWRRVMAGETRDCFR